MLEKNLSTYVDPDGNSLNLAWSARLRSDAEIEDLSRRLKQQAASGEMEDEPSACLLAWMERNRKYAGEWPVNVLFERIMQVADLSYIDQEEPRELCELVLGLGDGKTIVKNLMKQSKLFGMDDASGIRFRGKFFALSGRFAYGTNWQCAHEIRLRGGRVQPVPNEHTHYLVLGLMESLDSLQTDVRKSLEEAQALRKNGRPIRVVSEARWTQELVA